VAWRRRLRSVRLGQQPQLSSGADCCAGANTRGAHMCTGTRRGDPHTWRNGSRWWKFSADDGDKVTERLCMGALTCVWGSQDRRLTGRPPSHEASLTTGVSQKYIHLQIRAGFDSPAGQSISPRAGNWGGGERVSKRHPPLHGASGACRNAGVLQDASRRVSKRHPVSERVDACQHAPAFRNAAPPVSARLFVLTRGNPFWHAFTGVAKMSEALVRL